MWLKESLSHVKEAALWKAGVISGDEVSLKVTEITQPGQTPVVMKDFAG